MRPYNTAPTARVLSVLPVTSPAPSISVRSHYNRLCPSLRTAILASLGLSRANGSPPADSVVTAAASVLHSSALVADWISMREANAAVSRHIAITSTGAFQALRSIRNFQAELWELRSRVDDLQDQLTPPSPHDD